VITFHGTVFVPSFVKIGHVSKKLHLDGSTVRAAAELYEASNLLHQVKELD
jgi:hypothetical protein